MGETSAASIASNTARAASARCYKLSDLGSARISPPRRDHSDSRN